MWIIQVVYIGVVTEISGAVVGGEGKKHGVRRVRQRGRRILLSGEILGRICCKGRRHGSPKLDKSQFDSVSHCITYSKSRSTIWRVVWRCEIPFVWIVFVHAPCTQQPHSGENLRKGGMDFEELWIWGRNLYRQLNFRSWAWQSALCL